jgi:hypothetical protein
LDFQTALSSLTPGDLLPAYEHSFDNNAGFNVYERLAISTYV